MSLEDNVKNDFTEIVFKYPFYFFYLHTKFMEKC